MCSELTIDLELSDPRDKCRHPEAAADLPILWAAAWHGEPKRWVSVAMHWTGDSWALCLVPESMTDEETDADFHTAAQRCLERANDSSADAWRASHRENLLTALDDQRDRLRWDRQRLSANQERLRELECALAASNLTEPDEYILAHRLLPTWTAQADELVFAVRAILEGRSPYPETRS